MNQTVLRLADGSTEPIAIAPCKTPGMWRVVNARRWTGAPRRPRNRQCPSCGAHRNSKPRTGCASTTHAARYERMMSSRREARRA